MKLVFATHNLNKFKEVQSLLPDTIELVSLTDIGCHDDIPETAATIEGNALLKVKHVKDNYGLDCFADDTGLEVKALNKAPGVLVRGMLAQMQMQRTISICCWKT